MAWSFDRNTPVFVQIADRIRRDVISGIYPPGEKIPTVRQLAAIAAVNPNTVQRALTFLEEEGLIYTRTTLGRFVTEDEDVLKNARERTKKQTVKKLLCEANSLGISAAELIEFIKEETENG